MRSGRALSTGGAASRAAADPPRQAPWPDISFLRDPRHLLAIVLIALTGGAILAFLVARGDLAGADARAYWGAVRVWIDGGNPMAPPDPYLPYVYVPWSVPLFTPWAALPWDVAWFLWRAANVLLLLWTAAWAYRQHPLATALLLLLLAAPIAATLDTGNITLFAALGVWAAAYVGARLGGLLWALAAVIKWFPVLLFVIIPPRSRLWGLGWLALAAILSLATWPQTAAQLDLAVHFPRPLRVDYLLLVWAAVPWLWRHPRWLEPAGWPDLLREARSGMGQEVRALRESPSPARATIDRTNHWLRGFLGLD